MAYRDELTQLPSRRALNEKLMKLGDSYTLTVSEAWQMSGKNEDKFFDMVQDLAAFSAKKRNLALPEDETAGKQAGEYIKQQAKQDHDQLLYAVVDQAVRKVGKPASPLTSAGPPAK